MEFLRLISNARASNTNIGFITGLATKLRQQQRDSLYENCDPCNLSSLYICKLCKNNKCNKKESAASVRLKKRKPATGYLDTLLVRVELFGYARITPGDRVQSIASLSEDECSV